MATKKLVRSVVFLSDNVSVPSGYKVGHDDVVAIREDDAGGVRVFFRSEDEQNTSEQPMKYYHGFPFIIEDVLK